MVDLRNWNRLVLCSCLLLSCCHLSFHLVSNLDSQSLSVESGSVAEWESCWPDAS